MSAPNVDMLKDAELDDLKEIIMYQQGQIQALTNVVQKVAQDNVDLAKNDNTLSNNQRLMSEDMAKLRDAVLSLSTPAKEKH